MSEENNTLRRRGEGGDLETRYYLENVMGRHLNMGDNIRTYENMMRQYMRMY